uniref:Uncharacterized protein n=1 Tax=Oryza punctata TaxID=4537 RepID=A0A0E0JMR8_ORYPU
MKERRCLRRPEQRAQHRHGEPSLFRVGPHSCVAASIPPLDATGQRRASLEISGFHRSTPPERGGVGEVQAQAMHYLGHHAMHS